MITAQKKKDSPKAEQKKAQTFGLFLALLGAFLMALYPPSVRSVYADGANTVFMMLVTIWTRALFLIGFCAVKKLPLFQTSDDRRHALTGGFFQAISASTVIAALAYTPGPLVIMVVFTHTLMLLFFLVFKGEIKLTPTILFTTVLALIGLSFALDIWEQKTPENLTGIGIAFVGALAIVYRMYFYGIQTQTKHPAVVGAENFLVAALFSSVAVFVKAPIPPQSLDSFGWIVLACGSMALGTFVMFYGIAAIGSFGWSFFAKMEPIFTAILSAVMIGEILRPSQYMGMVLVMASLAAYQLFNRPKSAVVSEEETVD